MDWGTLGAAGVAGLGVGIGLVIGMGAWRAVWRFLDLNQDRRP